MAKPKNKKYIFTAAVAALLILVVFLAWPATSSAPASTTHPSSHNISQATPVKNTPIAQHPVDQASSLWAVVNKGRILPSDYVPANLVTPNVPLRYGSTSSEMKVRSDTAQAMAFMFSAAKNDGINLMLASGYRSFSTQAATYNRYVSESGVEQADTFSARPGHSEHQTGLAADIEPTSRQCELDQCFADLPEGKWLAANSYKYGFIIRYQKNTQSLTGYEYEPWHVRFLGSDLAGILQQSGQTLEQYFGLPTYQTYPAESYEIKNL
jgi:zinc D-Ala-D-Ala carboxypeptidase